MTLKQTLKDIKNDMVFYSWRFFLRNYLFNPSFRLLLNYRLGKYCFFHKIWFIRQFARYFRMKMVTYRNCDISFKSTIGRGLKLPHPIGIVIGEGVVIRDNVSLYQNVTLGNHGKSNIDMAYPLIEDNVTIFSNAVVVGGIVLAANCKVGACSFVNKDVPEGSVVFGVPSEIIN